MEPAYEEKMGPCFIGLENTGIIHFFYRHGHTGGSHRDYLKDISVTLFTSLPEKVPRPRW